jgi:hypothetical protein
MAGPEAEYAGSNRLACNGLNLCVILGNISFEREVYLSESPIWMTRKMLKNLILINRRN